MPNKPLSCNGSHSQQGATGNFAQKRARWLEQVHTDPKTTHAEFRLAYVISRYFSEKTGDAWPAQSTLAAHLGVDVRTIRRLTDGLTTRGHLAVRGGCGRAGLVYSMIPRERGESGCVTVGTEAEKLGVEPAVDPTSSTSDGPNWTPTTASQFKKAGLIVRSRAQEGGHDESSAEDMEVRFDRTPESALRGHQGPPNPSNDTAQESGNSESYEGVDSVPLSRLRAVERPHWKTQEQALEMKRQSPNEQPAGRQTKRQAAVCDAEFEAFWALCPRKAGKLNARRAYEQVIAGRRATHDVLTAGIRRYGAECANKDARYILHPASWLNQERWTDEPLPIAVNQSQVGRFGGSAQRGSTEEEIVEAARNWMVKTAPEVFQ